MIAISRRRARRAPNIPPPIAAAAVDLLIAPVECRKFWNVIYACNVCSRAHTCWNSSEDCTYGMLRWVETIMKVMHEFVVLLECLFHQFCVQLATERKGQTYSKTFNLPFSTSAVVAHTDAPSPLSVITVTQQLYLVEGFMTAVTVQVVVVWLISWLNSAWSLIQDKL